MKKQIVSVLLFLFLLTSCSSNQVQNSAFIKSVVPRSSVYLASMNYKEHIDAITNGSDAMLTILGGDYERKNAALTKAAYEPMKTAAPQYYPSEGCERIIRNFAVDISALTAAVLAALLLFGSEKNGGASRLCLHPIHVFILLGQCKSFRAMGRRRCPKK